MLNEPPQGLARYLHAEYDNRSWEGFRDYKTGDAYRELVDSLVDVQHGLCGYCEIDLSCLDRQVEHVVPRSDRNRGPARALDHTNMIACCTGGTSRNLFGPDAYDDEDRFFSPPSRNISCGQAKGNDSHAGFLDPRVLPGFPSLMRVRFGGRIEPDEMACKGSGFTAEDVSKTIEILGLNVERLRLAREKHWNALNDSWNQHLEDFAVMEAAARSELLPNEHGQLTRFFSTNRAYFESYGEGVLAEQPQPWI